MKRTTMVMACALGCGGCKGALFVGDPSWATQSYWTVDGRTGNVGVPLEDHFPAVDPGRTQVLDAPPEGAWRPIGDVAAKESDPAAAVVTLKQRAASRGADAVIRIVAGAGETRTRGSSEGIGAPIGGMWFDFGSQSSVSATDHHALGTAAVRVQPGTEAHAGIQCTNYVRSAYYGISAEESVFPYVVAAEGPAASAGVSAGDLVLAWTAGDRVGIGNCVTLNRDAQRLGPGGELTLVLWRPDADEQTFLTTFPRGVEVHVPPPRVTPDAQGCAHLPYPESIACAFPPLVTHAIDPLPATGIALREIAEVGLVVVATGATKTDLRPGDVLADFDTGSELLAAGMAAGGGLPVEVRREGSHRLVTVQLGAIPIDRYRSGNEIVREAAEPPAAEPPASAPSPPEPAPSAAGCGKDTDCKGDRICVQGQCVSP
jgi:hypothetical protein